MFVVGLDVAHVWTTIFRTYLDREELSRRKLLYAGTPLLCYALGVALYQHGGLTFWRVLAYTAVFHFVRQQVGWVAIYRARAAEPPFDKHLDAAVIYAATGFPLFYWHVNLPRQFEWFVPGDFVALKPSLAVLVVPLAVAYGTLLAFYVVRAVWRCAKHDARVNVGKHVVVATTAIIWFVGIVAANEDFAFTVTNVSVHAIPYMALLWAYSRERARERPGGLVGRIATGGVAAFLAVALALAFVEEFAWERLVWHDYPGWFGGAPRDEPLLSEAVLVWLVPFLSLPQVVHYVLDGYLWRRRDTGPAQARALGFHAR